jgi:hypothetical protein
MRLLFFATAAFFAVHSAAMDTYDDSLAEAALANAQTWVGKHLCKSRAEANCDDNALFESDITYEPLRVRLCTPLSLLSF